MTIYALFGDDIRVLSTNTYGDPVFWSINIFCLCAFTLEILLTCFVKVILLTLIKGIAICFDLERIFQ